MHVLVTGADGYIGALLGPYLMKHGFTVTGLDTGYYRQGWLYPMGGPRPFIITRDIREVTREDLQGVDAIAHLGELSNDPLGQQDPNLTHEINHAATVRLAKMAADQGIRRFVYMSSCSIYGVGSGGDAYVDETTPPNPQTAYAECKAKVERDLIPMAGPDFTPCFLRNATAFGASPRMRFDIVLNNLCGLAWTTGKIALTSDGSPWRPLVHARDICQAIRLSLTAPEETIRGQVFNVGATENNYRVIELAHIIKDVFPECEITTGKADGDNRSYRVKFDKIQQLLPDFRCDWDARRGAQELRTLFEKIALDAETFQSRPFTRLKMLTRLRETGQLDRELYWSLS